jgi:hypothetical protein
MTTVVRPSAIVVGLVLAAVALGTAGCATDASAPVPSADGPLLTVETRGGLCPEGPCGTTLVVERDGRARVAARPPNDLGSVPPLRLAALDLAIRAADFAELRRHPFTGTCPTAYDGPEVVYTFGAPGGAERVASCEVAIDPAAPLFRAVAAALDPFGSVPTS